MLASRAMSANSCYFTLEVNIRQLEVCAGAEGNELKITAAESKKMITYLLGLIPGRSVHPI
jgi:hypothetical protein